MPYVVLARKYRPRTFEAMVGQDSTVRALGNALAQQRLHHAYLFTGTRGIGKTTVSRIFAKCLNCVGLQGDGGITATPCGQCTACTQIDEDCFIDYIELDAASNRGINEVRDLLERAAYKPSVGRFKVFMIDEAHQLTKEAFNALLKTLEEPPDYVKFVLATTDPQKMPATVLSRCLQFNLRPMAPQTVREHLARVLTAEGIAFEAGALVELGRAAQGSMRDALSLADQAIAFGGGSLQVEATRNMLGSVGREPALALIDALSRRHAKDVILQIAQLRERGLSPDGTLESMAVVLQEMAVAQAVPGTILDDIPDGETVRRMAKTMPTDDTQLLYSIVLHGRRELGLAPDAYAGLTMVLLRMMAFSDDVPGRHAGEAFPEVPPSASKRALPPASAPPTRVSTSTTVAPAATARRKSEPAAEDQRPEPPPLSAEPGTPSEPIASNATPKPGVAGTEPTRSVDVANPDADPPNPLGDRWATVVAQLNEQQAISAMVRELAMQSALKVLDTSVQPPVWHLQVERDTLRHAGNIEKLSLALSTLLGAPQRLNVVAGPAEDHPAQREAAAKARVAREAERLVKEDPLVQDMLSKFKTARIVPGSIQSTQE